MSGYIGLSGIVICNGSIGSRYFPGTVDVEGLQTYFEESIKSEIRQKEIDPISRLETLKEELERQLTAEKLLKNMLGEEDYRTFINTGEIIVKSKKYENRIYIIRELGKIDVLEENKLVDKLCINPRDPDFPSQDQLVAKKLGLEEAEELILKTANHFPVAETTREEIRINRDDTFWGRILRR